MRLEHHAGETVLAIDLPGVSREEVDLRAAGGELVLQVRDARRLVALPDSVAGRPLGTTRLEDGVLRIGFRA